MSADHLANEIIGAFVDGELTNEERARVQAHLHECHACSLKVVDAHQLKGTLLHAAHRYAPSPAALARFTSIAKSAPSRKVSVFPIRRTLWAAAAAVLLITVTVGIWWKSNQQSALTAELLDQHLASLSDASSPEVISTDRHTVKPWFQGKLPFSFNLPEANALPPETVLQGADFTYLDGKPCALLIFSIRKHHASVFITQAASVGIAKLAASRSGFSILNTRAGGLDFTGVSDVNRSDLDALIRVLASVQ